MGGKHPAGVLSSISNNKRQMETVPCEKIHLATSRNSIDKQGPTAGNVTRCKFLHDHTKLSDSVKKNNTKPPQFPTCYDKRVIYYPACSSIIHSPIQYSAVNPYRTALASKVQSILTSVANSHIIWGGDKWFYHFGWRSMPITLMSDLVMNRAPHISYTVTAQ